MAFDQEPISKDQKYILVMSDQSDGPEILVEDRDQLEQLIFTLVKDQPENFSLVMGYVIEDPVELFRHYLISSGKTETADLIPKLQKLEGSSAEDLQQMLPEDGLEDDQTEN